MKKQEIKELLQEIADISSEYHYIRHKAPMLLASIQSIDKVPKELQDEFDDALREIEYIENSL